MVSKENKLVTNETATITENRVEKRGNRYCVVHGHPKKKGSKTDKPEGSIIKCFPTKKEANAMHRAIMANEKGKNMKSIFSNVTLNLKADKAKTRYETLEGKQYLVVPCVMLTEGVHVGSEGPLYYPVEELAKTPVVWNGKPVVVDHPEINGLPVSACDPVVFEKYKIGQLFNTKWEDGKLKTECWIDEDKANQVDERVMEAVENEVMMEVSTGLYTDHEQIEGEWNGEKYNSVVRNFRPDHLAVLPDSTGSCSIEDGAGLLRNAKEENTPEGRLAKSLYADFNELSHNEIWKELNNKIESSVGKHTYVTDVYDNFFIYETGDKLFHQQYEIQDDEVKLIGIRLEVEKIIQYQMADGTMVGNKNDVANEPNILEDVHNERNHNMNKEKMIDALIANEKTAWTEEDRKFLMGLPDERLTLHAEAAKEEEKPTGNVEPKIEPKEEPKTEPKAPAKGNDKDAPTDNQEKTVDEFIADAPEGMQDVLRGMKTNHDADKAELVAKITANERNPFSKEQLEAKELDELKQFVAFGVVPPTSVQSRVPAPIFGGQAEVISNAGQENEEEPLVIPVMNFSSE